MEHLITPPATWFLQLLVKKQSEKLEHKLLIKLLECPWAGLKCHKTVRKKFFHAWPQVVKLFITLPTVPTKSHHDHQQYYMLCGWSYHFLVEDRLNGPRTDSSNYYCSSYPARIHSRFCWVQRKSFWRFCTNDQLINPQHQDYSFFWKYWGRIDEIRGSSQWNIYCLGKKKSPIRVHVWLGILLAVCSLCTYLLSGSSLHYSF